MVCKLGYQDALRFGLRPIRGCIGTDLLTKTDSRPGIKRQEDERVWNQVFVKTLVDEPIRVEFRGCSEWNLNDVS